MGLRAPQRTVLAGLGAPHPDMRDDFYGAPPHALTMGEGIYARLRLALRPCGNYICGVSPRTLNRGGIYPTSRTYFGKKSTRPEKTKLNRFLSIK